MKVQRITLESCGKMLLPGLGLILGLGPEKMPAERKDGEIMTLRTGSL